MKVLTIGRASDNSLVLSDESVSRYHAKVFYQSDKWHIKDLQSTYGTFVNGKKIEGSVSLRPSDTIKISDVKLHYDGKALLSGQGRPLIALLAHDRTGPSPVLNRQLAQRKKEDQRQHKGNNLLVVTAIASTMLLITAIILVFSNISGNPDSPSIATENIETKDVVEYGAIQYDGGEYTGWLKNGLPHGQGRIIYINSTSSDSFYDVFLSSRSRNKEYDGEWQNGRKHGYGRMVYPDGAVQEGYWENNSYIGQSVN